MDDRLGEAANDGDSQSRVVRGQVERAAGAGRGLDHDLHATTLLRMRNGKVHESIAAMALMKQHQFLRNQDNVVALVPREELPLAEVLDFGHEREQIEIDRCDLPLEAPDPMNEGASPFARGRSE